MTGVRDRGLCSCVSEPDRGRRYWKRNRDAQTSRTCWRREDSAASTFAAGGDPKTDPDSRRRLLGLLMRSLYGIGTPRGLQGPRRAPAALARHLGSAIGHLLGLVRRRLGPLNAIPRLCNPQDPRQPPLQPGPSATPLFHGLLAGCPPHGHGEGNVVGLVPEVEQVLDDQTRGRVLLFSPNSRPNDDSVRPHFGERWTGIRTMIHAVTGMHVRTGISRTLGSVSHVRPWHGTGRASRVRPTVSPDIRARHAPSDPRSCA